jgi:tetratricopeptide (TPR) repeat protein
VASERAREFRKQGIAAAKAGQKDQARQLLQQSLKLEPGNEAAWLWMVSLARDQRERLLCLAKLLDINPNNEMGLQSLQGLGLTREQLMQQVKQGARPAAADTDAQPAAWLGAEPAQPVASPVRPPQPKTAAPPEPVPSAPGVPVPDAARLAQLSSEIDAIVRDYLAPLPTLPGVTWTQKPKGKRAGERDVIVLRLYIAGAVAGILVILLIGGIIAINTNPDLRGIVFAPTDTLTPTKVPPTATYTPTLGATPTASPTPQLTYTPSPTVPSNLPNGAENPPQPTDIYPPLQDRVLRSVVGLMDARRYDDVIPTLAVEVTRVTASFDPNPYYYQALALVGKGDPEGAAQVLSDALARAKEKNNPAYTAQLNAAQAYVDAARAQQALAAGQRGQIVSTLLKNIEDEAQSAISADPRLTLAYLALARRYTLDRSYDRAIGMLDRGLSVPQLAGDLNLIIEKANVYFQQGDNDRASYQAFLALYIDPTSEPAHLLRIRTALAQNNPGLAVLYAQAYLFYYPGSTGGYKLLGDARMAEGNDDLALEAYNQALAGGDDFSILVARAALYNRQRRYEQALDDLDKALAIKDDPQARATRMQAAYNAGKYTTASSDAEALLGKGVVPDAQIKLLQARILVDTSPTSDAYQNALNLLTGLGSDVPAGLGPVADEYRAKALYNLGKPDDALKAVNSALNAGETGYRHYLRGLIFEAQGQKDAAAREYDWVVTWGAVYPYPFLPDARQHLSDLAGSKS